MDALAIACIAPHGWLLLPFIGGPASQKASSSQAAMEEIGRRVAFAQPDTLVIMTPHGLEVEGVFSLLDTPVVRGETGNDPSLSSSPHSFTLQFNIDQEFNEALVEAARTQNIPTARVKNKTMEPLLLDFATTIPLWFTGARLFPPPKIVVACAGPGLDWKVFPGFGAAIRRAAESLERRIGFIASADMGHAHDPDHRYGYDPAAREFEQAVVAAIQANDLGRLLSFDGDWVMRAKTDAYGQLLTLYGILQESELSPELLSYEIPTYYGMLSAVWASNKLSKKP